MTYILRREFARFMSTLPTSLSSAVTPRTPLRDVIVVCGTTGVGKSQLAVTLAQSIQRGDYGHVDRLGKYNKAIVLSADSMQLYKGLDVITNKVNVEEQGGIEHWGLDMVTPGKEASWELGKWCSEADKKIASLPLSTLPIICGGTHYFMQHFLFPPPEMSFARDRDSSKALETRWTPPRPRPPIPDHMDPALVALLDTFWTNDPIFPRNSDTESQIGESSRAGRSSRPTTKEDSHLLNMYQVLQAVDPAEAFRWHWRDGRKVRRSLERWWERGGAPASTGSEQPGRKARFRTLIFWVYEPPETLEKRLHDRVDAMLKNGLLREITEMRQIAEEMYGFSAAVDHTEGVFQAIGYKEFSELALDDGLDPTQKSGFADMLRQTKSRTYQYAKSQLKWIRKQLLPVVTEARLVGGDVHIYVVPGGGAAEAAANPLFHAFLNHQVLPDSSAVGSVHSGSLLRQSSADLGNAKVPDTAARQAIHARQDCPECSKSGTPTSVKVAEWDEHLRSRRHKRALFRASGEREYYIQQQLAKRDVIRGARKSLRAAAVAGLTKSDDMS